MRRSVVITTRSSPDFFLFFFFLSGSVPSTISSPLALSTLPTIEVGHVSILYSTKLASIPALNNRVQSASFLRRVCAGWARENLYELHADSHAREKLRNFRTFLCLRATPFIPLCLRVFSFSGHTERSWPLLSHDTSKRVFEDSGGMGRSFYPKVHLDFKCKCAWREKTRKAR